MENHRLRNMLDEANTNYNALQMHLASLMQDRKAEEEGDIEEQQQQQSGNIGGGASLVPRQFMDLGLATNASDIDEPSLSSSVGRSTQDRSKSPANNIEVGSKMARKNGNGGDELAPVFDHDHKKSRGIEREDSPQDQVLASANNNVPKFSPPRNIDQAAEATMRKARVSVRARSEAPMVLLQFHIFA